MSDALPKNTEVVRAKYAKAALRVTQRRMRQHDLR